MSQNLNSTKNVEINKKLIGWKSINSAKLDEYYYQNLDFRYYSLEEIKRITKSLGNKLLLIENNPLNEVLIRLRVNFLINEVFSMKSNYYRVLIGISYLTPYVSLKIVRQDSLNVFLARDAAFDFLAAKLLNNNKIYENSSIILFISRKNLKYSYESLCEFGAEDENQDLSSKLKKKYLTDIKFKKEIISLQKLLKDAKVLNYSRINFIDSWAEGKIFALIKFAMEMELEITNKKYLTKKTKLKKIKLFFSVANPKKKVKVVKNYQDYINTKYSYKKYLQMPKYFYEYFKDNHEEHIKINYPNSLLMSKNMISRWFEHANISFKENFKVTDFQELMTAKIYKELNHFGSLNFGHPIDWDPVNKKLIPSSPDKQIGNYLREIIMINSIVGFKSNYQEKSVENLKITTSAYDNSENVTKLSKIFKISNKRAQILHSIMYAHNEHFATCTYYLINNLILNLNTTMIFLGDNFVKNISTFEDYDFQYFLNFIKEFNPSSYKRKLFSLINFYGLEIAKNMFSQNLYYFINEFKNINITSKNINRDIRAIVLDIDGTLTPIEKNMPLIIRLLKKKYFLAFITGRPRKFCQKLAHAIKFNLKEEFPNYSKNIFFYCSNGSTFFQGDDISNIKRFEFTTSEREMIKKILNKFHLRIVSSRDYRFIVKKENGENNVNELLFIRNTIFPLLKKIKPEIGVYLINWHNSTKRKENLYNSIDISSSSKEFALKRLTDTLKTMNSNFSPSNFLVIGDEPENSDREILDSKNISVESFGSFKTSYFLKKLTQTKYD